MQESHRHDYTKTSKLERAINLVESVADFATGTGLALLLLGMVVLAALSI